MDPASVVGLVAACANLVKTCTSVVKALHDLREVYKNAEISIISMIDECENVRFAWTALEEWARNGSLDVDENQLLLERFQRSVYTGRLCLEALEKEIDKVRPKGRETSISLFPRRVKLAWNATGFQEHQNRIRGQNASLQLLLQVVSMPRKEDCIDIMSRKGYIFREADESVLSIIPSRMSSRLSTRPSAVYSDRLSIRTSTTQSSPELFYVPFDFEDDLFTSHVYKRNYRLPNFRRKQAGRRFELTSIADEPNTSTYMSEDLTTVSFLLNAPDQSVPVSYLGKRVPFLHAVLYALHCSKNRSLEKQLIALIHSNADLDEVSELCCGRGSMSPLALAAALGLKIAFTCLLTSGAQLFRWSQEENALLGTLVQPDSALERSVIGALTYWALARPMSSKVSRIQVAVLPRSDQISTRSLSRLQEQVQKSFRLHRSAFHNRGYSVNGSVQSFVSPAYSRSGRIHIDMERDLDSPKRYDYDWESEERMATALRHRDFQAAWDIACDGVDVCLTFHERLSLPLGISIDFLWFAALKDRSIFEDALERMALVSGAAWMEVLRMLFFSRQKALLAHIALFSGGEIGMKASGSLADDLLVQSREDSSLYLPYVDGHNPLRRIWPDARLAASHAAFELRSLLGRSTMVRAAKINNERVLKYMIRCHYDTGIGCGTMSSPVVWTVQTFSVPLTRLLIETYEKPVIMATQALNTLMGSGVKHQWSQNPQSTLDILRLCLEAGVDPSDQHLLHIFLEEFTEKNYEAIKLLLEFGADPDAVELVEGLFPPAFRSSTFPGTSPEISSFYSFQCTALFLAVILGKADVVCLLLESGATSFFCDPTGRYLYSLITERAPSDPPGYETSLSNIRTRLQLLDTSRFVGLTEMLAPSKADILCNSIMSMGRAVASPQNEEEHTDTVDVTFQDAHGRINKRGEVSVTFEPLRVPDKLHADYASAILERKSFNNSVVET